LNNQEIIDRIEQELAELEAVVNQVNRFLKEREISQSEISQEAIIDAIALSLHSFYTGTERVFKVIARQIDYSEPSGENWHRQLLEQMSVEVPDVRPALISSFVRVELDELRRFRHVVRSIYAYKLEAKPVLELANKMPVVWQNFKQEIRQSINWFMENVK